MKHFKKEALLFVVVLVVAVVGLLQLFHEEAYATPDCSPSFCGCDCPGGTSSNPNASCHCPGEIYSVVCSYYCSLHCDC